MERKEKLVDPRVSSLPAPREKSFRERDRDRERFKLFKAPDRIKTKRNLLESWECHIHREP